MYQEDPWPYILKVSEKYSETSNYFEHENSFTNLVKDSTDTNGNFTFSTENINLFSSDTHDKWNIWFEDSYTSGSDSKISYKPYKNDLNLNLIDAHLKMKRVGDNTVLEGVLRGIKLIMSNIRDNEDMAPQLYKPFKYRGKDFIRIPDGYDRGAAAITSSYVISLNNWDIL